MIIVDYLQLMHGTINSRNSNREQEIAHISRSLKSLAKEINVPVVALSQLSRAVETRGGDKRPQLSDLRESGSIEQDADVVCFIYRAERYGITVDEHGNSTEGLAEVIIGKQRNGPIGSVQLAFVDQYARFENLTTYYAPPEGNGGSGGGDGFSMPSPGDDEAPF
jgi:replicative DNA helicase